MFAHFSKIFTSVAAVVATSALVVACDGSTGAMVVNSKIVSEAPEYKATYRDGEHPHERTNDMYAIPQGAQCPTEQEIISFVERYSHDGRRIQQEALEQDGLSVLDPIDHYSYETVIGTIDAKCLPSLDGSSEYKPGSGNEKLRDSWFNFQNVYKTAIDIYVEGDESEAAEARALLEDYGLSLQLLGVVSSLMGGPYFSTYLNQVPHITNPETYDGSRDESWSTEFGKVSRPLPYVILGTEAAEREEKEKTEKQFEETYGVSFDEYNRQHNIELMFPQR